MSMDWLKPFMTERKCKADGLAKPSFDGVLQSPTSQAPSRRSGRAQPEPPPMRRNDV
jgi:hypothetical protein